MFKFTLPLNFLRKKRSSTVIIKYIWIVNNGVETILPATIMTTGCASNTIIPTNCNIRFITLVRKCFFVFILIVFDEFNTQIENVMV